MTRPLTVGGLVIMFAVPAFAQDSIAGMYQSSIDGRIYEVRQRGEQGLDIYSTDGRIMAVMDRNNVKDDFKGRTDTLAVQCPNNAGKIETTDISQDRIRMRVELPNTSLVGDLRGDKTSGCFKIGFVRWQRFDLLRYSGAPPARDTSVGPMREGGGTTATLHQVQFEILDATAQADVLTITLAVTNQGADRPIQTARFGGGGQAAQLIDDTGNTYGVTLITFGNQQWTSDLISGVRTRAVLTFRDMATVGGVIQARTISRLTLRRVDIGSDSGSVEFRNIAIRMAADPPSPDASAPAAAEPTPAAPDASITTSSFSDIRFEVTDAVAQGNVLTVNMVATNGGIDRTINTGRMGGGARAAQVIDDFGNTFGVALITIGNQSWTADLVNGVRTAITLTFRDMPTIAGVLQANQIRRLTFPNVSVGQANGSIEFRNLPIRKTAN